MRKLTIAIWITILCATLLSAAIGAAVSSCVTKGPGGLNLRADTFIGSAPVNFGGPDGSDPDGQDVTREMVTGRSFDFTPTGFTLSSGPLDSEPADASGYGISNGSLAVAGDQAQVDLDVSSTNPDVTNAQMTGTFSLGEASSAIVNPGRTFTVEWDVRFDYLGVPLNLSMEQELAGSDFV